MRARLPILTFHAIEPGRSADALPVGVLRACLTALRERGFTTVDLSVAAALARSGDPPPPGAVVLTFDDAYRSVYEHAYPLLAELGMTATVFVAVGDVGATDRLPPLGGRERMSWSELGELAVAGFSIGAHSISHGDLTRLPAPELERELAGSRARIEAALGVAVSSFAYPYGRHDARVREGARRLYACACSDRLGFVRAGSDPYALERIEMYYFARPALAGLIASPLVPAYLAARSVPRTARRLARMRAR